MADREKVIKGLEICGYSGECKQCPYEGDCENDQGFSTLALDSLALLKAQEPGWISVQDRLPETRHVVLAFSPHYNNIWALSLHEDGFWYYWADVSRKYDPLWMGPITYWMPLPEPPKEG